MRPSDLNRVTLIRAGLILTAVLGLAACETVKGAGKDITTAGKTVQQEATKTQAGY